ncbi:MAG: GTPase ObgE [Gemmatimonadota bacterium]|nr:GTPase ObgE [Gemmatimonadota bacterium]MDE2863740.1 GTPase ObgE [Gemmatimonadota bacterium]MYB05092.1 GTPase ObgE [Gemmatimonadota bacterium]
MFIDSVTIEVRAGQGGSGAEAFRREKGVPRGGPSGGDGGRGGDVRLIVDPGLTTLSDFRYRRHHRAGRGMHGEGSNRTGRSGGDLELRVPPGTIALDNRTDELLGELLGPGETLVVARGGRGGRGNARFASATRQAPRRWEPGEDGEERIVRLELKLLADIGLVGEPNAGKSTLLSRISRARPRIAAYPFTTLTPNLGVVELPDYRSFVVADIPGLIEGAHDGRGLGHQFLRHIERTRALAILLPVDGEDPAATLTGLRRELEEYSPALTKLPWAVVFSKMDLHARGEAKPVVEAADAWDCYYVSAVTGHGLGELLEGCWRQLRAARPIAEEADTP